MASDKKHDALWWAAKRGDEALVKKLMLRYNDFGPYNKNEAAKIAVIEQHPSLLELIVDSPFDVMNVLHDQKTHIFEKNTFHLFKPIIEKVDFSNLSEQQKRSLIVQSAEFDAQDLVQQWIALLPPQMGIKKIGEQLIKKKWMNAFDALQQWAKNNGSQQIDDGELLCCAIEHDAYEIWSQVPQWKMATFGHQQFYGPKILKEVWKNLPKKTQQSLRNNTHNNQTLTWMLEQKILNQKNITNIIHNKIDRVECETIASLFLSMSTSTKKKFFSQNSHFKNSNGKVWAYLFELVDIDSAHPDNPTAHILWHEIKTLNLLNDWVIKDNAKAIHSWMSWIAPNLRQQLLVVAARSGALQTFQMLHQEFDTHPPSDILTHAARYGQVEIVQYLLSQKPTEQDLVVAACQACCGGHLNVVKMLCSEQDLTEHEQILSFAFKEEQTDILNFLFRQGFVLDPSNTQWDRWIRYAIGSKNDEITPSLSSRLPHHPYNATLFGSAVNNGLLNTATALLPLFDHHLFSFPQAVDQFINSENPDLKMMEFLLSHCEPDQLVGKHLIGEAACGRNWVLVDQLAERFGTPEDYSEATWYAIHFKKIAWVRRHFSQCDLSFMNNALLLEAGRANHKDVIDMFYPHYTIDEVAKVVARLRVEKEPASWDEQHLLNKYHNHLQRLELEQAVEGGGTERRKRLM